MTIRTEHTREPESSFLVDRTFEEPDFMSQYLQEIGQYPLLTAEQEVELAKRIEAGKTADILLALRDAETKSDTREAMLSIFSEKAHKMSRRRPAAQWDDGMVTEEARLATLAAWEEKAASITEEAAAELALVYADGETARDLFICSNLRLVVSIAKRYKGLRHLKQLDVVQEGNAGLMHAVDKFDYRQGFKFSTYADWWIKQAIARARNNQDEEIRIPVRIGEQMRTLGRLTQSLAAELQRQPTDDELAAALDTDVDGIRDLQSYNKKLFSLDRLVNPTDGSASYHELRADPLQPSVEEQVLPATFSDALRDALDELTSQERYVVERSYGFHGQEPVTQADIGREIGVSQSRISYIEKAAIRKIRRTAPYLAQLVANRV